MFGELPVYFGQAILFFIWKKDIAYCLESAMLFMPYLKCKKRIKDQRHFTQEEFVGTLDQYKAAAVMKIADF